MSSIPPIWSSLTPEEHEFQYNPQAAVPDYQDYRVAREPANAAALGGLARHADIAYGDHPLRTLDIYPAAGGAPAPVHVFLHGGYWRAQDKANFAFVAGALVPHGVTTVVANYELCPAATLDEVAASAIAAMRWVVGNIADHGGDPGRISLSGHSAGAHLGAEIVAHDWAGEGISAPLAGATLISGIFDPTPTMATSVNADLHLTEAIVARRNVEVRPPALASAVALFAGGREPWQWIDQTYRYAHHLHRHGLDPAVHVLPGRNHFDILDEYLLPQSLLLSTILGHAGVGA
ncbi:alpha/beta hydrolase [Acuticoccus mangrovi]|uniref:Alpha/beta hydrolase n=1 Tax=Acuticoccus mangrovi TaxID=2796142 RepID=A0A934MNJ4_9HYPH|nr:alpha/beta hydrolase [Acuticoccus mangrovi]MBJ3778244.1 alpha/beta hydrolase [Acuticoccus mangrovi]